MGCLIMITGAIMHIIFLFCLYDIRMRSQVYTGRRSNCTTKPISRRLVIFLSEGVNGQSHISLGQSNDYFRSLMETGAWGTPRTERIGVSALTAIESGLEVNKHPFLHINIQHPNLDSILNYSHQTIYIGAKNKFQQSRNFTKEIFMNLGDSPGDENLHVINELVSTGSQFQNKKLIILVYIEKKAKNTQEQLSFVNNIIRNVKTTIDTVFNDSQTTYIISTDAPQTPGKHNDSFFLISGPKVRNLNQTTIDMIDLNAIASYIIGSPMPSNSLGKWYEGLFNIRERDDARIKACNALHIASLGKSVMEQTLDQLLETVGMHSAYQTLHSKVLTLEATLSSDNTTEIISRSNSLKDTALDIINQDGKFMRNAVRICMHFAYVGWGLLLLTTIIHQSIERDRILKREIHLIRRKIQPWFFGLNLVFVLGGILSVALVILQGWPLHYVLYLLPPILIWGCLINFADSWLGYVSKLNCAKLGVTFTYLIIYLGLVESYTWGIVYNPILAGNILFITLTHILICYAMKEFYSIKLLLPAAMILTLLIFIPTNKKETHFLMLILSGMTWLAGGLFMAFFMWVSKESIDAITMILCLMHYSASFVISCIHHIYPSTGLFIVSAILMGSALIIPIVGKANRHAIDIPHDVDRFRKSNRLHHLNTCLSSMVMLLSVGLETLLLYAVHIFLMMWLYMVEPSLKLDKINRENAHNPLTFVTLIILIQHLLGLNEPTYKMSYTFGYLLPEGEFVSGLMDMVVMYLIAASAQVIFTALTMSSGGESLYLLAMATLDLCGYRLFLEISEINYLLQEKLLIQGHISLQILTALLFLTLPAIKVLLRLSVWNIWSWLRGHLRSTRRRQET